MVRNAPPALLRPRAVASQLGIAPATLRVWSDRFAEWLSPSARGRTAGTAAQRAYAQSDVQLLRTVQQQLNAGLTFAQVRGQLGARIQQQPERADSSLDQLFATVRARLPHLPRKQAHLAQVLLQSPETMAFGSMRELAQQHGVNSVTIFRFAQALGFNGYQALQTAVRRAYLLRAGLQAPTQRVAEDPASAVAATVALQDANLARARQQLAPRDLEALSDLFGRARRVVIFGSGAAVVVAALLARLLRHVGVTADVVPPSGQELAFRAHDFGPGDVAVGIGLWLTFEDVVHALDLARRAGAQTVALVGSSSSPLVGMADHVLLAPSQGDPLLFSVVAPVAVVETLIAHLAGRRPTETAAINEALHDWYLQEHLLARTAPIRR